MKAFPVCAGLLLTAAVASCQVEGSGYAALLQRVRTYVARESRRLPNYTCTEHITRSTFAGAPPKLLRRDRLRLEVAFVERKELFAWPGDPFRYAHPGRLIRQGMSAAGDFATSLIGIFVSDIASFDSARPEMFDGRRSVRFTWRIAEPVYKLMVDDVDVGVACHGSFWVDAATERLLAVDVVAEDIPEGIPVSGARMRIEFQPVVIGGSEATLPRSTLVTAMRFPSDGHTSLEDTNRTEFRNCREYAAQSAIDFGERDAAAAAPPASVIPAPELPPGIRVRASLDTPIDAATSAAGDAISATVLRPFRAGPATIPKGARLLGRLLLLHIDLEKGRVTAALEFSHLQAADRRLPFHGRLGTFRRQRGLSAPDPAVTSWREFLGPKRRSLARPATFEMRNGLLRLPAGFAMEWVTAEPAADASEGDP